MRLVAAVASVSALDLADAVDLVTRDVPAGALDLRPHRAELEVARRVLMALPRINHARRAAVGLAQKLAQDKDLAAEADRLLLVGQPRLEDDADRCLGACGNP